MKKKSQNLWAKKKNPNLFGNEKEIRLNKSTKTLRKVRQKNGTPIIENGLKIEKS